MSFNKTKAMKSAERYLTQGKIQAAINEYRQVVENDPNDINSRNMLGDLYTKADDSQAAVNCYKEVAEHYNKQGFAKKAIAIYNKIYRIEPDSLEVASQLAELYHVRGSIAEAQKHYETVAKRYEETGHKDDALLIWEKIAEISPYDTEIFLKIADAYWQADRKEDAAKAYIEGGNRLGVRANHDAAITAYSRALEVTPDEVDALKGFVNSQLALGYPEEGAKSLEKAVETQQYHKDLNYLLMDCYFDMNETAKAEQVIIKLVERDPSNYPKLLDLVAVYLESDDLDSAARILSMVSEHMLVGGESDELFEQLNEVLARNPEHIAALRLLARFHGWQRDELELQQTLERLAESARLNESIDDERYALSQYLLLVPHDVARTDRLNEINSQHNFDEGVVGEQLLNSNSAEVPSFESFAKLSEEEAVSEENPGVEMLDESDVVVTEVIDEEAVSEENIETLDNASVQEVKVDDSQTESTEDIHKTNTDDGSKDESAGELSASDEVKIEDEIESIKFYIEQGYAGLAEKSLGELEKEFGDREQFAELRAQLPATEEEEGIAEEEIEPSAEKLVDGKDAEKVEELVSPVNKEVVEEDSVEENLTQAEEDEIDDFENEEYSFADPIDAETAKDGDDASGKDEVDEIEELKDDSSEVEEVRETEIGSDSTDVEAKVKEQDLSNTFDDFKTDLGLDSAKEVENDDYDEHYHHAVAYQEMGLLEEAISGFQDAINCVKSDDGTRRHLNCCTLLGHCFLEKEMPKLSVRWFKQAFDTPDLTEQEKHGVKYELGNAYEAMDEIDKSIEQFESIYAKDVSYRDVSERLEGLREKVATPA